MKLEVINTAGQKTGKSVTLDDAIFGIEPNDHAIYLDVKRYLAAQRTGTHKSKHRGEISGSTRKLHRQKRSISQIQKRCHQMISFSRKPVANPKNGQNRIKKIQKEK